MGIEFLATGSKSASGGSSFYLLFLVVAGVGVMYLMMRGQRSRQRQVLQTQRELGPGQTVRTTAGIYGVISAVDGDDVMLEIAPDVEIRILRRAIMEVIPEPSEGDITEADDQDVDASDEAVDTEAEDGEEYVADDAEETGAVAANEDGTEVVEEDGATTGTAGAGSANKGLSAG